MKSQNTLYGDGISLTARQAHLVVHPEDAEGPTELLQVMIVLLHDQLIQLNKMNEHLGSMQRHSEAAYFAQRHNER